MKNMRMLLLLPLSFSFGVKGIELPGSCNSTQYYDPGAMACQSCPANASMVTSGDGFSCICEEHSIPAGIGRCRQCNATEVVSTDGLTCVPRRCQGASGRVVCRKCPADYISVTRNLDGSPTKEVQCIKCARGYRPSNNVCVRCEACACAKSGIVVRERCLPKKFVNDRPKYQETKLHPNALMDIVKYEYLCFQNDLLACRSLANECVKNFYVTDLPGPCRLWVQPKIASPKGLPTLTLTANLDEKDASKIDLTPGMNKIDLALAVFTSDGGLKIISDSNHITPCLPPLQIHFSSQQYSKDCHLNFSQLDSGLNETMSLFLTVDNDLLPLPVALRKPDGTSVQRGTWPNGKFRRFFLIANSLQIAANMTSNIYLQSLLINLRVERTKLQKSLQLHLSAEAQYATKSPLSDTVTISLKITNELPSAGVLRGLEIWGGVLGTLLSLYGVTQWRGNMRRGGLHFALVPIMAAAISDALYFAALFSTLHALAAEAGTLGITLPLSHTEEHIIKTFVYSAVGLKALKLAWINWNQCRCDIFFLDWAEYNPPTKGLTVTEKSENWRAMTLSREWSRMQTLRRASPMYTVTIALVILQFLKPWQSYLPESMSYKWVVCTVAWWAAYTAVVTTRWGVDKALGPPTRVLPRVCTGVGMSLLVFQEEYYAHYVHGRNDESDARSLVGPLAACRVVCAPQLRAVYKQLSMPTPGTRGFAEKDSRKALLSKFLAAFFERALDGLSWVASERTVPERLLDVELVTREAGNTSALLYDPEDTGAPSCFAVTWWGEEWALGTFDAMLFGCVFIASGDELLAALIVLVTWQITKFLRSWYGNRNQREKTDLENTSI